MSDTENSTPLVFEDGILFYNAMLDGAAVRAGITFEAFERLVARAGLDQAEGPPVQTVVSLLQPTIEAYLEVKHFHRSDADVPLIIVPEDLVTH